MVSVNQRTEEELNWAEWAIADPERRKKRERSEDDSFEVSRGEEMKGGDRSHSPHRSGRLSESGSLDHFCICISWTVSRFFEGIRRASKAVFSRAPPPTEIESNLVNVGVEPEVRLRNQESQFRLHQTCFRSFFPLTN